MSFAEDELARMMGDPVHSDISQHLHLIRFIASGVNDVVEVGTHDGTSAMAIVAARPRRLTCCDIARQPEIAKVAKAAAELGVEFAFHEEDSRTAILPPAEMYLIDSLHTYDQVRVELERFAGLASRYLVFHDTVSFGWRGQEPHPVKGINDAIGGLLRRDPDWRIGHYAEHCCGMAVLVRVGTVNLWKPPFGE